MPGTIVAQSAGAGALAGTAQSLGQVLGRHLSEQLLLVARAQNVNLLDGDGVEPALDGVPYTAEAPGGVDQVHLTQTLGVVVLRHGRCLLDVRVHLGNLGDTDALEVHDGAASLEELAGLARAGGQTRVGEALVLNGEVGQHALGRGDLVHRGQVDATHLLNIDRTTILEGVSAILRDAYRQRAHRRLRLIGIWLGYLVCLVVVLRVELEERLLLGVVPDGDGLVKLGVGAPLLAVDEPAPN